MAFNKKLLKETLVLRAFGLAKVPLLFFLAPSVQELEGDRCVVRIPLTWRSKNHLGAMYFGSLCAGADCAAGLLAMRLIQESGKNVSLVFKDFQANFLKRAEGDVDFVCEEGGKARALVEKALSQPERVDEPIKILAFVPKISKTEPVAEFTLTLSLKRRT